MAYLFINVRLLFIDMDNEDENYYNLLQNLNDPQSEEFEQANKIITQMIMDQDQDFLQGIINVSLNANLEANESFFALNILKEYLRKSMIFDKFHDAFPKSTYTDDQIQLFQNAAYRFFPSSELSVRNIAADLYFQAFRMNIINELTIIPQMLEKLMDKSTQFEEILTTIECFNLILTELELDNFEEKLFFVLLDLLTLFSDREAFDSSFFQLLSNFSNPIFHLFTEKEIANSFIEIIVKFYQEKVSLKNDIIIFLQSSCLDSENYCIIVEKILPLIYEDLSNIDSLPPKVGLTILEFINSDLMDKYPNMIEIFLSQFLSVILHISQLFNLDDNPEFFVEDEWELFNAAQDIIKTLLTSQEYSKEVMTIVFNSILPFIEEGLVSDDIHYRSVSMNFLNYSMMSIDPELINQSISSSIVNQSIMQTIENQYCRVRYYAFNLLYSSYNLYGLDIASQYIEYLFKSVFDCEPIAFNAINILSLIGKDEKFTLIDPYFQSIQEILTADQLLNNSSVLQDFTNLLLFPEIHHEYSKPVSQFILALLEQSLSIPEEQTNQVNVGILHVCCWVFASLIQYHFDQLEEEEINSIIELCISIYQRYSIGTELFIIACFIIKLPKMFINNLKLLVEMAVVGISNADSIYSFSHFISYSIYLEVNYDLSDLCEISLICGFIDLFNATQNFDIKVEVVSALFQVADLKISLFTEEFISNSIEFFNDLSENVPHIYPIFQNECYRFYRNTCLLFEKLVKRPEFQVNPKSFFIIHQLIINILDIEPLFKAIISSLMILYNSFYIIYKVQLHEYVQEQEVYMEKYAFLNQILKKVEAESQKKIELESEAK